MNKLNINNWFFILLMISSVMMLFISLYMMIHDLLLIYFTYKQEWFSQHLLIENQLL